MLNNNLSGHCYWANPWIVDSIGKFISLWLNIGQTVWLSAIFQICWLTLKV